jgi:hypothetical protein
MIGSLEEAQRYTQMLAMRVPELATEIELRSPGLSDLAILRLRQLLARLPVSYLDIVRRYDLNGIAIGYFRLHPRRFERSATFADALAVANSGANPLRRTLELTSTIEVAAYEADPLCVSSSGTSHEGTVWRISFEEPDRLRPIAANFGQLIVLACRLDALREEHGPRQAGVDEFLASLASHELPHGALDEWRWLATIALDDE